MNKLRVCFVAAPLLARSGVYKSGRELVTAGRELGENWSLFLGVAKVASGNAPLADENWITEQEVNPAGLNGVRALAKRLATEPMIVNSDIVVSLNPQTDMALAFTKRKWVAFTRGLPWPAKGETPAAKAVVWRVLERLALARASAVWATTDVLRTDLRLGRTVQIVPAGIAQKARSWDGTGSHGTVVWAARFHEDKNPQLFVDTLRALPRLKGVMYGTGALERELRSSAPTNVTVGGWVDADVLWQDALAYVGTSHREAFGRSAAEAAMNGIPVVLADTFGAAPFLITDPELRKMFVLPLSEPHRWTHALSLLSTNGALRSQFSDHLAKNASQLTIVESAKQVVSALNGVSKN